MKTLYSIISFTIKAQVTGLIRQKLLCYNSIQGVDPKWKSWMSQRGGSQFLWIVGWSCGLSSFTLSYVFWTRSYFRRFCLDFCKMCLSGVTSNPETSWQKSNRTKFTFKHGSIKKEGTLEFIKSLKNFKTFLHVDCCSLMTIQRMHCFLNLIWLI